MKKLAIVFVFVFVLFLTACTDGSFDTVTKEPSTEVQSESYVDESTNENYVENVVFVTRTGSKYHIDGCRYINGKNDLTVYSVDDAIANGYTPCSVCL